jgi:hypothetical protein
LLRGPPHGLKRVEQPRGAVRDQAQSFDVGPAVIDCHAIFLICVVIGTLEMVASSPQRRHPTKP